MTLAAVFTQTQTYLRMSLTVRHIYECVWVTPLGSCVCACASQGGLLYMVVSPRLFVAINGKHRLCVIFDACVWLWGCVSHTGFTFGAFAVVKYN